MKFSKIAKLENQFLTKNGKGRFVVLDIDDYEKDRAEKKCWQGCRKRKKLLQMGQVG